MNQTVTAPLYGAIEAGGTKFVCAIGRSPDHWLEETRIATTTPADTLPAVLNFFDAAQGRLGKVESFGVASFGPVDINRASANFGALLATPKRGWEGANLPQALRQRFARPVAVDTDVSAAALAEQQLGAGRGLGSMVYVTVGTGIGGGAVIEGRTLKGLMHPEMGHIRVRRHDLDMDFAGTCPFHGDCLEGLASGPAITARWGATLQELGAAHAANGVIADYLGQLAATTALMVSCERIVFGGGVFLDSDMLPAMRSAAARMLNGYLPALSPPEAMQSFIAPAMLGTRAGLSGAMLMAMAQTAPVPSGVKIT